MTINPQQLLKIPRESDPWLFVMTGLNVTIDIEYEHDQLEVSKGADLLITNQNFSGLCHSLY